MTRALLAPLFVLAFVAYSAEPVLVGHWKLDEKEGDVAVDSSPSKNNGKIAGGPARTTGKFGGALAFDGKAQFVEIPNSKDLENVQEGSFTVAAWVKPEDAPAGKDSDNNAQYAILAKTGWHMGLTYTPDKKYLFAYWLKGEPDPKWVGTGAWDMDYEPGEWHHVAAVIDKESRTITVYLDGEAKGTSDAWEASETPREYDQTTWKIGAGNPGSDSWAWHAKAAIGDVRIYNGALSAEKVKAIYDGK